MAKPHKKPRQYRPRKPKTPSAVIRITVDKRYALYGGDVIECRKDEGGGLFTCEFVTAVPARATIVGETSQWTASGKWVTMPHGIFDVEREVVP